MTIDKTVAFNRPQEGPVGTLDLLLGAKIRWKTPSLTAVNGEVSEASPVWLDI